MRHSLLVASDRRKLLALEPARGFLKESSRVLGWDGVSRFELLLIHEGAANAQSRGSSANKVGRILEIAPTRKPSRSAATVP